MKSIRPKSPMAYLLLTAGSVALALAVLSWGTQYKLSLYHVDGQTAHAMPTAKLLSEKERPKEAMPVLAGRLSLSAFCSTLFWALPLVVAFRPATYSVFQSTRRLRPRYGAQIPCFSFFFFRPPPPSGTF